MTAFVWDDCGNSRVEGSWGLGGPEVEACKEVTVGCILLHMLLVEF